MTPAHTTGTDAALSRLPKRSDGAGADRGAATVGLAGKALEILTLVALVTVLPRALGSADFGVFALALSVVLLGASSVALGGPTVASRFLAAAPEPERAALARSLALRSARWRLGAVLAAALVTAIVLAVRPGLVPVDAAALVLAALALDVAATLLLQVGLALGAVRAWSFRYPLQNTTLVVGALGLYAAFGRTGALLSIPIASAAALVLASVSTLPRLRGVERVPRLPPRLARFAVVQSASGLLVQAVHRGGAIAVALLGGGNAETGFAAIAAGIATATTYVVWQVYTIELPRVARQAAERAERATRDLTRLALVLATPVALGGVLLCPTVVPTLLGREYEDAVPAIAVALAMVPLAPAMAALNQVAALRLRPEARLLAVALGFVGFGATALALVPDHGAAGAAGALVVGSAVTVAAAAIPGRLLDLGLVLASLAAASVVGVVAVLQ